MQCIKKHHKNPDLDVTHACKVTYNAEVCTMSNVRTHGASLSLEPAETVIMMPVPERELVAGGRAGKSFTAVSRPHRHVSHRTIADVGANTVKSAEWKKWYESDTPYRLRCTDSGSIYKTNRLTCKNIILYHSPNCMWPAAFWLHDISYSYKSSILIFSA